MKTKRILRRNRLKKLEKKRIKRNEIRKRLRISNEMFANLIIHKMKIKQGLKT